MTTQFIFRTLPYGALSILGGGVLLRYVLCVRQAQQRQRERQSPRVKAESASDTSAATNEAFTLLGARRRWRWTWLGLLGAHVVLLTFPDAVLRWNQIPLRLYLLEGSGLLLGLASFCAGVSAVWRHVGSKPGSRPGQVADAMFLSMLMLAVLSGLLMAIAYRWASSWGVATLTPYVRSLLQRQPEPALVVQVPFVARLHLVTTFGALAFLPFTRVAPALLLPIHHALTFARRPILAVTTAAERWLRDHNPSALIWPEEDGGEVSMPSPRRQARREARRAARVADGAAASGRTEMIVQDSAEPARASRSQRQ